MGRTPGQWSGKLVALNKKKTGEEIWALNLDHYIWSSSPSVIYDEKTGTGYVIREGDSEGSLF